jgi:membrane protein implicated in regulation of membrane protease activity
VALAKGTSQPGWWTLAWQVLLGVTGLALLLLIVLAFLIAWLGRRRRAHAEADRRNDRAA